MKNKKPLLKALDKLDNHLQPPMSPEVREKRKDDVVNEVRKLKRDKNDR